MDTQQTYVFFWKCRHYTWLSEKKFFERNNIVFLIAFFYFMPCETAQANEEETRWGCAPAPNRSSNFFLENILKASL